jgi:O-antigen/teichoic acid export membrane protein
VAWFKNQVMIAITSKKLARLKTVISGALLRLMISLSNVVVSIFIINTQSASLWGQIVSYILFVDMGFTVINWGSSIYLIREFSNKPDQLKSTFFHAVAGRALFLGIFIIALLFSFKEPRISIVLIIWSFARFCYQSLDPIIQFDRDFTFSTVLEAVGIASIIIPLHVGWLPITVESTITLFTLSFVIRALCLFFYKRKFLFRESITLSFTGIKRFFLLAFPFFLITLSALFQQRADLYCVALFLDPTSTAHYQVFLNLLILNQIGASLLLNPFVKNIFRLSNSSVRKLERKFILAGYLLTLAFIPVMYLVVRFIYHFDLSWEMYLMGYIYNISFYFYLIRYYELSKTKLKLVYLYSFLGCIINIAFSLLLTPYFGIKGALLAGLITQLFMVFMYYKNQFINKLNSLTLAKH